MGTATIIVVVASRAFLAEEFSELIAELGYVREAGHFRIVIFTAGPDNIAVTIYQYGSSPFQEADCKVELEWL